MISNRESRRHQLLYWLFLLISTISHTSGNSNANFRASVPNLQKKGVVTEEILKWWGNYQRKTYPRVFPTCIVRDEESKYPDQLSEAMKLALDDLNSDDLEKSPRIYGNHSWLKRPADNVFADVHKDNRIACFINELLKKG